MLPVLSELLVYLSTTPIQVIALVLVLLLLLLVKKNCALPIELPTSTHTKLLTIYVILFGLLPALALGWGYFQAYFPNYKYAEMTSEIDFYLYQPEYLPPNFSQITAYHFAKTATLDTPNTVRAHYGTPLSTNAEKTRRMFVMDQSKIPTPFSLISYADSRMLEMGQDAQLEPVTLQSFPNAPAFILSNSLLSTIMLQTNDGVLISVTSIQTNLSQEELVKVSDSLH